MTLLIDGDHLFVYRIGFAVEKDRNPSQAVKYNITSAFDRMINKTLDFDKIIFLTGKDNFRDNIATILPYKGNRKLARKPKMYRYIRDYLVDKYNAVIIDGMEADDGMGIAQMQNYHSSEHEGDTGYCASTIVACDKDMDMIPGNHYNPVKDKLYWIDEFTAYKNFYTQVLTGDSTDNIPGLKGTGKIGAANILNPCKTIDEMRIAVCDAYRLRTTETRIGTWKLELKGNTRFYKDKGDFHDDLYEIEELLWIRRE